MDKRMKEWTNKGFSLIETTIGIALFAIALLGMLMLMNYSLAFGQSSNSREKAINDARRILEQIRTKANNNGLSSVTGTSQATWNSFLSGGLPQESASVTSSGTDPLTVTVSVSWQEKGKAAIYTAATLVTKR